MAKVATGKGFELELHKAYLAMAEVAEKTIPKMVADYPKVKMMWELLRDDSETNADWDMANYIVVSKLGYNDHGDTYIKIVATNALKMLEIPYPNGVLTSIIKERVGAEDDAHLGVLAGALLHEIGNQVHRESHNVSGVYLTVPLLNRLLPTCMHRKGRNYKRSGEADKNIVRDEQQRRSLPNPRDIRQKDRWRPA